MEAQESYSSLFEDKDKYNTIMGVLAGVVYREMQMAGAGRMVADAPAVYG